MESVRKGAWPRERAWLLAGRLLALAAAATLACMRYKIDSDGLVRYRWLLALLDEGRSAGMIYSSLMPLFSAPFLLLDRLLGLDGALFTRFNLLLFLACVAFLYRRFRHDYGEQALLNVVLLLVCGSLFTNLVNNYFGEVFTAVFVLVGLVLVHDGRALAGWCLAAVGAANTPAVIPGLALVALHAVWRTRDWRHLLAPAGAALLMAGEVWLRNGSLATGYAGNAGLKTFMPYSGQPGFSYPFVLGVLSILFSFGKGLVFYIPGIMVRPAGERSGFTSLHAAMLLFVAGEILVYSRWWAWYGGLCWGPRFFLFACFPAALALGSRLAGRGLSPGRALWLAVLALFSLWVGADGAVYGDRAVHAICWINDYTFEVLCWYAPEYSTLFTPFVFRLEPVGYGVFQLCFTALVGVYLLAPLLADALPPGLRRLREALSRAWSETVRGGR